MPVPTSGASVIMSGTAWRCMLAPIRARLASLCSRNGMSAVATDTICCGDTSMYSTSAGSARIGSPPLRHRTGPTRRSLASQLGVGLGDDLVLLLRGVEALDVLGDLAVHDPAVRGLDEPELVQGRVAAERADQADVRALGGLDGAHAPVVGLVDVAHLDGRALAGEAAGAERRQAPPVGEPGQRVGLVHELRELRRAEELLERRDHRADVDDRLRRDGVDVLGAHPLADDALHPVEADAEGLLDELADRAQAPVAEVLVLVEVAGDLVARHRRRRRRRSPWSPRAARS